MAFGEFLGIVLKCLVSEFESANHGDGLRLIDDGQEPSIDVLVGLAQSRLQDVLVEIQEGRRDADVGQG